MKNKLLYGILIGLGTVLMLFMAFPFGMLFALALWVYFGVMFLKKKRVFHEKIEPQLAKRQLKRLKNLGIVAGLSFIIAVVSIVVHNLQSNLSETHEFLYFYIGIIALYLFILVSIVSFVILLMLRQSPK